MKHRKLLAVFLALALLSSSVGSAAATTYAYQPDNLRLSKTVAGARTTHVWDGGQMVAELNASNGVTAKYLRAGGRLVASANSSNAMTYYLHNGHGDVAALADASGALTRTYRYDAFGNEEIPLATDANPFRYAGEYFDKETGSVYLRARYYSPAQGRFNSADTHWNPGNMVYGDIGGAGPDMAAIMQSSNLYAYAGSNPVMYVDRTGAIFETVVDVANLAWSGYDLITDPSLLNAGFFLWDIGSLIPFVPGSYVAKVGAKVAGKVDEAAAASKAVKSFGKIPTHEYNAIRKASVKNPTSNTLTLGKYKEDASSYTVRAGNTKYFDLGKDWDAIQDRYKLSEAEMFEYFNKPVLDDALAANNTIRFSHDPRLYEKGAIVNEWAYIKSVKGLTDSNLTFKGGFWIVK